MITLTTDTRFQGARSRTSQPATAVLPQRQPAPMSQPVFGHAANQPSAALLKALYLPTPHRVRPLRFAGGPSHEEIQGIIESLDGWQNNSHIVGPSYFAEPKVVDALAANFITHAPIPDEIVDSIALHKTRVQNIHNLLLGKPPVHPADLHADAVEFTKELTERIARLNEVLRQANISEKGILLFNRYAAKTAPVQYAMGFPDAVAHSADVAQLTFLQAKKHGALEPQLLQALLVGWLHDPKLPGAISWSNLATHPPIASSIAEYILTRKNTQALLDAYLQDQHPPMSAQEFTNGVVEALSINNDSKFIMDNVILHKATHTPLSEPGIADIQEGLSKDDCEAIEKIFQQRFLAPSLRELPEPLSAEQLQQINQVEFSTDLRGIKTEALANTITPELLEQLLKGDPADLALWTSTQETLKEKSPATFIANPKVKGGTLASHHAEVTTAPLAALALATADPLLLSPHKIIAQTRGDTVRARLASFLNSLDDNLNYLPHNAQVNKPLWRKQVLESILQSAQEITENQQPFAKDDTEALRAHLLTPSTWQGKQTNYANLIPDATSPEFQKLLTTLKKHYEEAVNTKLMV